METQEQRFEKEWEIFVLTGMPWKEIKELNDFDREAMYKKAVIAKERAIEQQRKRDEYLANLGNQPDDGYTGQY